MSDGFDDLGEAESSFGPGFDLIVGLLAVVLVSLQLARVSLATAMGGDTDLTYVAQSKDTLLRRLCDDGGEAKCIFMTAAGATQDARDSTTAPPGTVRIEVADLGTNQTLRIGNELLFGPSQAVLTGEGRAALQRVIGVIWNCRDLLREVQVQGHADRQLLWRRPGGNLQLAADRAIAVYNEFIRQGVDPKVLLLSAATYDSFKPVDRDPGRSYDWKAWDTQSEQSLQSNRRVEFHLIYRLSPLAGTSKTCR